MAAPNNSSNQLAVQVSSDGQAWITRALSSGFGHPIYPPVLNETTFGNGLFVATAKVITTSPIGQWQHSIKIFTSTMEPIGMEEEPLDPAFLPVLCIDF